MSKEEENAYYDELKEIVCLYIIEVGFKIIKEICKCPPEIQNINPSEVFNILTYKILWMTDIYAFYRFFGSRLLPLQQTCT